MSVRARWEDASKTRHAMRCSEVFVTRLDGGVQTLEHRPSVLGDEHLERAKLLAAELGVEFREI